MICKQCQELISDYIDGLLELGEQVKIERHLADCEPCRAVRDDLLQIVHFSQKLPERAPSSSLWARIQSDIAEQQPAGFFSRAGARWAQLKNRHFNLSIPQLVASAAAMAIVISLSVTLARRDLTQGDMLAKATPVEATDMQRLSNPDLQQLEQQISQLSESVEQRKSGWNSELRAAFERNLYYINQSLAECKHQLNDDPSDDVSQELMLNAYREKVRLLEGFKSF
ncbi:MAG TPA: zf-HC2 domain-containing protein [Blastocatellia bacterium]|nr:zf-HC2 domain-containing protein [Blastocatellia bacterium]